MGEKKAFKLFEAEKIHSEREEKEAGTERRSVGECAAGELVGRRRRRRRTGAYLKGVDLTLSKY
jgi:hypothetical protein